MTAREDALTLASALDNPLSDQVIASMSAYDRTETIAALLVMLGHVLRRYPAVAADLMSTAPNRQPLILKDCEQRLQHWARAPFAPLTRAAITQLTAEEARDCLMTAVAQLSMAEATLANGIEPISG